MKITARLFSFITLQKTIYIIVYLIVVSFLLPTKSTYAATQDTSFGIANYLPIADKQVDDGDIVSFSPQGYFLSKVPYDSLIVGVVTSNPAISLEINGPKKTYAVVATGDTYVRVSASNGTIKKGDPITTSTIPGVGTKGTHTGYILGAALVDYKPSKPNEIGKIPVTLNVQYYVSQSSVKVGLFDVLNLSTLATYEEPIKAFKYFVAALVVVIAFAFGFFSFARTANKGLEALGRNPLAAHTIQLGILINIIIAVVIVLVGLIVAFVVVRL